MTKIPIVWLLLLSSLLIGVGRFTVPGHDLSWPGSYEAFSHIWVGATLTLAIIYWHHRVGKLAAILLITLSILETVVFLLR